jgi:hypothetical protein
MSVQIIKRVDGEKAQKQEIRTSEFSNKGIQISFNNWNHLSIRYIQNYNYAGENGHEVLEGDTLLVFDNDSTRAIINFIQDHIRNYQIKDNRDSLPF